MALSLLLSWVLSFLYLRVGQSLSDRRGLARALIPVAMTTMLIITLVKSSLALSLGLVGALSIVRFRTAIKEPEELAYLFVAIAIGVGCGANQRLLTIIAFVALAAVFALKGLPLLAGKQRAMALALSFEGEARPSVQRLTDVIGPHCRTLSLQRFEESATTTEAFFYVDVIDGGHIEGLNKDLRALDKAAQVALFESRD